MDAKLRARMINIDAWFEAKQSKPLPVEFYLIALAGEVGEAANLYKKKMRGDSIDGFLLEFGLELADIEIYLRHLARKVDIDLDSFVEKKIGICEQRWNIPLPPDAR